MSENKRDDELGALWRKTNDRGQEFMTGSCLCLHCNTKTDVVVFVNGFKKSDNHPDFRILKSNKATPSTRRDEQPQYQQEFTSGGATPAKTWPPRGQQVDPVRQAAKPWPQTPKARQADPQDWTQSVPPPVDDDSIPF